MEGLSPRERSAEIEEEGVGTLQSVVTSLLLERGAGRAGTAPGATFPRELTGAVGVSGAQLCSLQLQPAAKPLSCGLGTDPREEARAGRRGWSAHLAPLPPALPAPTAGSLLPF